VFSRRGRGKRDLGELNVKNPNHTGRWKKNDIYRPQSVHEGKGVSMGSENGRAAKGSGLLGRGGKFKKWNAKGLPQGESQRMER